MARVSNWPAVLLDFLEEKRTQHFNWQNNNCCLFACDWIKRLTGIDPAVGLRKRIKSEEDAKAILAEFGGVEQIAADRCALHLWPEVPVLYALRGDIAMIMTPEGPALGVVAGKVIAHAGPNGVTYRPLTDGKRAWRIN